MSTLALLSKHLQEEHMHTWAEALPWLQAAKTEARKQLANPAHYRGESYRYSRVPRLMEIHWDYTVEPVLAEDSKPQPINADHDYLIFIDGVFAENDSCVPKDLGVSCRLLTEIKANCPAWLKTRWDKLPSHWSEQTNLLLAQTGVIIDIPAQIKLIKPIDIIHYYVNTTPSTVHTRHAIRLQRDAEAIINEYHISENTVDTFSSSALLFELEEYAKVQYYSTRQGKECFNQLNFIEIYLDKKSEFNGFHADFSGDLLRTDLHAELIGQGASIKLNGIFLGHRREQIENQWLIRHIGTHTQSQCLLKGIADGEAQGICRGRIEVLPTAAKTKASLYNRNLLLHPGAQIDSLPELVILQDDVQCAHGSTIGQLDATALFYLQSRGLTLSEAKHLLITAFVRDQLSDLPDYLSSYLFKHLPIARLEQNTERGILAC